MTTFARAARVGGASLGLTLALLAAACLASGKSDPRAAYGKLRMWDGEWYGQIVDAGYWSPKTLSPSRHGNVGFFPGYPLAARLVKRLTGLDTTTALLVTAQLSAWAGLTYLLLFLRDTGLSLRGAVLGASLVALHPGAFFLVAAYSESLFLAGLLGFVYWSGRPGRLAPILAGLHGAVMTGTRLVGVPLVVYPVVRYWLLAEGPAGARVAQLGRPVRITLLAACGAGAFFAYCQYEFGHWDQYMRTLAVGWGVVPDYAAPFTPRAWLPAWPGWGPELRDPNYLSRLLVPAYLAAFAGFIAVEVWRSGRDGLRERLALYLIAFLLFYYPASGYACKDWSGMIRYTLCVQVVLVAAGAHALAPGKGPERFPWWRYLGAAAGLLALAVQLYLARRFTHGGWVA